MTKRWISVLTGTALAIGILCMGAPNAAAHTDADVIAVPAGSEATIKLKPNHGCGDSPTVEVFIQAPVPGATAGPIDGWTQTATPDTESPDKTVLEWSGGSLPTDLTGEFPVTFQVPDTPGELLTFPAVQGCENGEELSWINGDPDSDYPAPRLLVLPAGSTPATSLDQIPLDAPGRDLLAAIVNVDSPADDSSTTSTITPSGIEPSPTSTASAADTTAPEPALIGDDDASGTPWIALGLVAALVLAGAGFWFVRRRTNASD
jgi:uncharacterized protein YcnI